MSKSKDYAFVHVESVLLPDGRRVVLEPTAMNYEYAVMAISRVKHCWPDYVEATLTIKAMQV